jgi:imidazolonepropionase-like amidohydrolase
VAFTDVSVLPMTRGDTIRAAQTVIVRDGIIVSVGPAATAVIPRDATVIGARGQYLMPGLVDAHVHLEYFDDPGVLALFLANGITTVRNMDGRPYLLEWRRRIASGELPGPTIYSAGPILDGSPPARDDNMAVATAAEARAAVGAQDSAGYDFIKLYTNLSPEAYAAAIGEARARRMTVAGHVPRRVSLRDALTSGQHSVEHLADFDELVESDSSPVRGRFDWSKLYLAMPADSFRMTSAAREVAAAGIWIVPTAIQADRAVANADSVRSWLARPEASYISAEGREFWEQQAARTAARLDSADWVTVARGRANRRAMIRALHAAGANVAVGTDTPNPFVVPGFSIHEELANFTAAGFSPLEALAAATRKPARLLGAMDSTGTVEVGKYADLLLLPGNPLLDLTVLRRPSGVMIRGTWLTAQQLRLMLQLELARNRGTTQ